MRKIDQVLYAMISYFGADARRINHAMKVYGFATSIANEENVSNELYEILAYSAILHDIGIHEAERKHNSNSGKYQEIEGPAIAKDILQKLNIDEPTIQRVCYIISKHHTYTAVDNIDFQILVEADFLVNIFEDEMSAETAKAARDKYFKTSSGVKLLNQLYLVG